MAVPRPGRKARPKPRKAPRSPGGESGVQVWAEGAAPLPPPAMSSPGHLVEHLRDAVPAAFKTSQLW